MRAQRRITREAIVKEAVKIIAHKGAGAVTFQAIATAFGVSKQAIIYWYPNKWALVGDICLPFMREEAENSKELEISRGRYLYATAAAAGPASGMRSKRLNPTCPHHARKSAPV